MIRDPSSLYFYWSQLYGDQDRSQLDQFVSSLTRYDRRDGEEDWYKDAVIYALYVDLFNADFQGLIDKINYLSDLGVTCLWLLPVLDSPMRDGGFDIRNYGRIREDLLSENHGESQDDQQAVFDQFLVAAHQKQIRVIFDIAMNHTSDEHPWFLESSKKEKNVYSDFYIWEDHPNKYADARLIFKGIEKSNWEAKDDRYYFHRFFSFQPDLNYRNPRVLLEMSRILVDWQKRGVDGFRMDAIPYLWKEEGTDCENLEHTHTIVKFFRAVLDHVCTGTLLLAEACQQPVEVCKYFGDDNECHAAYHFPLMPMIYKSIIQGNGDPIKKILGLAETPEIGASNQWLSFLRVHDELSLERVYVSEQDRKIIHDALCHEPEWDFRMGEGISARLSELMQKDVSKILLSYSIMLTLLGTPVIYYGDEFGKLNDKEYYLDQIKQNGKDDTRFLVRGKINWEEVEQALGQPGNFHAGIYDSIRRMVNKRQEFRCFGRGSLEFVDLEPIKDHSRILTEILAYQRIYKEERILVVHNLSPTPYDIEVALFGSGSVVYAHDAHFQSDDHTLRMKGHGILWWSDMST